MSPLYQARCGIYIYHGNGAYANASWPLGRLSLDRETLTLRAGFKTVTLALADVECLRYGALGGIQVIHHAQDGPRSIWINPVPGGLATVIQQQGLPIRIEGNVGMAQGVSTAGIWAGLAFAAVIFAFIAFSFVWTIRGPHRPMPVFPRADMEAIVEKLHHIKFRGARSMKETGSSGTEYQAWADREADGLRVTVEISGDPQTGYGYYYSQQPWPAANEIDGKEVEMFGPFRAMHPADRIDDHWWLVRVE